MSEIAQPLSIGMQMCFYIVDFLSERFHLLRLMLSLSKKHQKITGGVLHPGNLF